MPFGRTASTISSSARVGCSSGSDAGLRSAAPWSVASPWQHARPLSRLRYGIHTSLTRMHLLNGPLYSRRLKMANQATTEKQVERTYSEKSRFAHSQAIDRTQEDV